MKRRTFIAGLGSAAAWPVVAPAQQPAVPVIGWLSAGSPSLGLEFQAAFLKGLSEAGYVEGPNVAIAYRWAEGHNDRLPALAADLVRRRVAAIRTIGIPPTAAAKAETATIPIVFSGGFDPVAVGFVASLARPGGNLTGVTSLAVELAPKRLELLHELVPTATSVALLVDPANPVSAETQWREFQQAARILGLEPHLLSASSERDIETVFTTVAQLRAGGLMSYGDNSLAVSSRLTGGFIGRILKMLWGGSGEHISIAALSDAMEPRHDETQNQDCERFQPMSRPAGYGRDIDRGDRRNSVIMQTFLRG